MLSKLLFALMIGLSKTTQCMTTKHSYNYCDHSCWYCHYYHCYCYCYYCYYYYYYYYQYTHISVNTLGA